MARPRYNILSPSVCPSKTFHLLPQSKDKCTSSPAIYVGPSSSASCNSNLVKLHPDKKNAGIWKLIKVVEPPPPSRRAPPAPKRRPPPSNSRKSPPPPPAVVNVQIPKVEVSIQIPNYTVETFGNEQKAKFCDNLVAASKYPASKINMVYLI